MSTLEISRQSLALYQAVSELRAHQLEVRFSAGSAAAAPFTNNAEQAYAASYSAEKAAIDNFEWPTGKKWLTSAAVLRLNVWLELYMEVTGFNRAAAQGVVLKNLQDIHNYEERLLKLADWSCEANHQDADIRRRRNRVRQELADFYTGLGHHFDAIAWVNDHHGAQCNRCKLRQQ